MHGQQNIKKKRGQSRTRIILSGVIPMCLSNSYKIYVSVKRNNLLHNIMLTATCFDTNESSSGHPSELIQDIY